MSDPRAKFIVDKLMEVERSVKPDSAPYIPSADDMETMEFGLKIFDALLPMVISHVVAEYKRQAHP